MGDPTPPAPGVVVVVAAHGSRAIAANDAHRAVVARLAQQVPTPVVPAFLELTEPSVAEAIDQSVAGGAATVVVLPYFLHPGRHLVEDLPRIVAAANERHPSATIRLAPSFGADPVLGQVLATQVARAVTRP